MERIDFHTHFFGPVFYRTLAAAAGGGDPAPGLTRLRAAGVEPVTDDEAVHTRRWLREMEAHGVTALVSFASIPEEAESVATAARASEGRLVPFSLIDPTHPEAPDTVDRWARELGIRGLILFPAMHRFHPADPALDPVYEAARSHRLPLIVHMGVLRIRIRDLLGLPSNFDLGCANPIHLVPAAQRFPDLTFVIPHFGGGYFRETLMAGAQCPNVAVDTSSSNDWMRLQPGGLDLPGVFRQALEVFGPGRILFGTDSSVFPRGWRADLYRAQVAALDRLGLPEEDRARILGGNARRLLGPALGVGVERE